MILTYKEAEIILLKAIQETIDAMVNFEVLTVFGIDPDSEIRFKSTTHQRFFNIILVDFLSRTDKSAPTKQTSYLGALRQIAEQPSFDLNDSIRELRVATREFIGWLEQEVQVDVWLPSIDKKTLLKIARVDFLKMCGDISKHNFLRAVGVAKKLQQTLESSGVRTSLENALLALSGFYERFHSDIMNYHGSTIAEFLNNIRWGLYEYLQPEFRRSLVCESDDPPTYRYTYPTEISSGFAKECYWELMNAVRNKPYVRKFEATKWLKLRY